MELNSVNVNNCEYKNIDICVGSSIDDAVRILLEYQKSGDKVSTNFNGVILYSDTVTIDDAYKKITGLTKSEFQDKRNKERKESERK